MKNAIVRAGDFQTPENILAKKFPHLRGGNAAFRIKPVKEKLQFLSIDEKLTSKKYLSFSPSAVKRNEGFSINIFNKAGKSIELVRIRLILPSSKSQTIEYAPPKKEEASKQLILDGFTSAYAGDLYADVRIYYADGSVTSDAVKTLVLSRNPDQLVITPRVYLISGRAGKVEYDWDTAEFHCRANATITNGSTVSRTYNQCSVRVTNGGEDGDLITAFSFAVGPFTVAPANVSYRTIDTWFPKGTDVWEKFNLRWDLTFKFTYESTAGINVSDTAAYRPMSTVPVNIIDTEDFTASQESAEDDAYEMACEILEDRDITLNNPFWMILGNQSARNRYSVIDIGWDNNTWDFDEVDDMYEEISATDGTRMDVFIPLSFAYASDVPSDKRNIGGVSTVNGPYPKDDDRRDSGCLVLMDENDHDFFGIALAHEICHYLGLGHELSEDNLMHKNGGLTDHVLTWDQWSTATNHGMMKWLAPDI